MDENIQVYLRPLREEDAYISYKWRNNPNIWKYTGSRPDRIITEEIEFNWIHEVLKRKNEKRYAICIEKTDEYVGNAQLTGIDGNFAEFHIFIGEEKYWGKSVGFYATKLMLDKAVVEYNISEVYSTIDKKNIGVSKMLSRCGFVPAEDIDEQYLKVVYKKKIPHVSIFMMAYNHEKYIAQALESILMQKVDFDYEIVIGDDASKDNTRGIIFEYVRKDPQKFRLIFHDKNIGAHANQDSVLKACEGKYTAILEGDDYWTDSDKLQKQSDFLEKNVNYVIHSANAVYSSDNTEINNTKLHNLNIDKSYELKDFYYKNNLITCTTFFRTEFIGDLKMSDSLNIKFGDWLIYVNLLLNSNKKAFESHEVMAVYREHSGGTFSGSSEINKARAHIDQIVYINKLLKNKKTEEYYKNLNKYFEIILLNCKSKSNIISEIRKYFKITKTHFPLKLTIGTLKNKKGSNE